MQGPILRGQIDTYLEEAKDAIKNLIGLKIFPEYGSPLQSGQYLKLRIALAELLNADVAKHAPGAAFTRYTRTFEYDNFDCIEYGIEELVPYVQADETSRYGLDQQSKAAELAMRRMLLAHEIRVAAQVYSTANFTAQNPTVDYTTANGGPNITTGVNFVADVLSAKRALEVRGIDPFGLSVVISSPLWDYVKQSEIMQNYLRGNRPTDSDKIIRPEDAAAIFDLQNVYVGRASYNTAAKNQPASLSYIWSNAYFWIGKVEGGDFSAGGAGRTIFWEKYGNLFTSEEYPEYQRDSAVVRVKGHMIEKVVDPTCGQLVTTNANF